MKIKRPCNQIGCPELTLERYCAEHKKLKQQKYEQERGSAAQRGYGSRWRKYRVWYLLRNPFCACQECKESGSPLLADVVDHIIPHKGDYTLFWDPNNHQPMNSRCHNRKTAKEDGRWG
jgi:5-methylcytosine-specific restriction protein A